MIDKLGSLILLMLTLLTVLFTNPVLAADQTQGAKIFAQNCAACHANGGNIIRRGKNLKKRALQRHKKDSIEAISSLVKQGKFAMPAYADRLSEAQIGAVAAYVLEQAENNWE